MLKPRYLILIVVLLVAGCVAPPPVSPAQPAAEEVGVAAPAAADTPTAPASDTAAIQAAAGFGPESGMMERHHADVPAEYVDLVNATPADEDSLQRGQMVYAAQCETCHGASGMGDGPAGQGLDPAPAPIAHTSQMLSDGYLYWRISEGGHSFETAMPAWGEALSEQARWDLINYVRSLEGDRGQGQGMGRGQGMGGQMMQRQGQMLNAAVAANLITQGDADFFQRTQQALLDKYADGRPGQGRMIEQAVASGQAVADGVISQADADRYAEIHDKMTR
ncbi:MAG TPA: cytochrome c [Anaerolineae bacterium]|nr:cytochrome c [Anaerolineae bacterium]